MTPYVRALNPRLMKAMDTAAQAHKFHSRKASDLPYVAHLIGVFYLLTTVTHDEDVLIAGLLHDTVEDVPERYPREQLVQDFGERVAGIVDDVTKDDSLPDWHARSEAYLHHLEYHASHEAVMLSCADKLHNLSSMIADHAEVGDALWDRFNAGREDQEWWYTCIHEVVNKRLPGLSLNRELGDRVAELKAL